MKLFAHLWWPAIGGHSWLAGSLWWSAVDWWHPGQGLPFFRGQHPSLAGSASRSAGVSAENLTNSQAWPSQQGCGYLSPRLPGSQRDNRVWTSTGLWKGSECKRKEEGGRRRGRERRREGEERERKKESVRERERERQTERQRQRQRQRQRETETERDRDREQKEQPVFSGSAAACQPLPLSGQEKVLPSPEKTFGPLHWKTVPK